jgi:putative ABC transport system permease protein
MQSLLMPTYLAVKEVWRNKGRFLLVSLVIALITLLVLFISALGEGLGNGNREYISKIDANLLIFHAKSDYIIGASRVDRSLVASVNQVQGVADAAQIGFANATILLPDGFSTLKTAFIGVEPGHTGEPPVLEGRLFNTKQAEEVVLDRNTAQRGKLKIGNLITLRVTQGTKDVTYNLKVVGITDGRQYSLQPSIFVPFLTWDKMRPKSEGEINSTALVSNVIAVRLDTPSDQEIVKQRILSQISRVDVANIPDTILAVPGYTAQQSTIQTQGVFTMFIGLLVIGGFFQIQILQKVAQIGVLKAIGASNYVVGAATIIQISLVTIIGVTIGGFLTYLLSLSFPPTVPIVFNGQQSAIALVALLLIGPIGGLVSIRYAVRIEPLKALGLSS